MLEILGLVSTIILALLLVAIAHRAFRHRDKIPYYRPIRNKLKKQKEKPMVEPPQRMFVAIRRHPAGRAKMMAMEEEEYEEKKKITLELMDQLVKQWSGIATFKWGFHGSEYGLPSSNEEDWLVFASFLVSDHDTYRTCLDMMQSESFIQLRQQFDIRLLYGEKMFSLAHNADELFRQIFSR